MTTTQTAEIISPPVFAVAPEEDGRDQNKPRKVSHPDRRLIGLCIEFTSNQAAADGAFEADPSGNSDFASTHDDVFRARAARAMEAAAKLKAHTLDGLRSKAGVARGVLKDMGVFAAERNQVAFLKSFTEDVIRMQRAVLEQHLP